MRSLPGLLAGSLPGSLTGTEAAGARGRYMPIGVTGPQGV